MQDTAQFHEPLYPISHDRMVDNFDAVMQYSENTLEFFQGVWSNDLALHDNPSLFLLQLGARPELAHHDQLNKAYSIGVFVGTLIVRKLLQDTAVPLEAITMELATEVDRTVWLSMKGSRHLLRQFFEDVDVKQQLHDTVEAKWQEEHVTFLPKKDDLRQPANDWVAVGLGDTLAIYGLLHADYTGQSLVLYTPEPLKLESEAPELFDVA